MIPTLMLMAMASLADAATDSPQQVQSRNGEFIFSQYPPRAKAAGEQGTVKFRAEVDAKGNVLGCKVTEGSGHKRLDRETCDLIIDHASFKPTLDSEGTAREAIHDGVVNWRIPGVAATERTGPKAASAKLDQVVCKRITKSGSLVSHSRLCMTRREWIAYADRNQSEWGDMQGRLGNSRDVNCNRGVDPGLC